MILIELRGGSTKSSLNTYSGVGGLVETNNSTGGEVVGGGPKETVTSVVWSYYRDWIVGVVDWSVQCTDSRHVEEVRASEAG